ncbi:MAG: hypothetical protein JWR66_1670 [Modestobacter sp.]|nr:hypothetical protein [Modestobacter sp.]
MPRLTIAMISHVPEGDAFFDVIEKGTQDAAGPASTVRAVAGRAPWHNEP